MPVGGHWAGPGGTAMKKHSSCPLALPSEQRRQILEKSRACGECLKGEIGVLLEDTAGGPNLG